MMREEDVIVGATAVLTRNYADLPFDAVSNAETAGRVISRTAGVLHGNGFTLHLLREMTADNGRALAEKGQIPAEMAGAAKNPAVLLPLEGNASVALGGSEHVFIMARRHGSALPEAVADCLAVEDQLSRRVSFAFDGQMGYLQASAEMLGTGLRAALVVHVPLLVRANRLPEALRALEEMGLRGRFCGMMGKRPRGDLLAVENRCAIGRTEQEICQLIQRGAEKVLCMEAGMRQQAAEANSLRLTDRLCRAQGLTRSARLISEIEFWCIWSDLRLGAQMELLPLTVGQVDALLPEMMDAHLRNYAEEPLAGEAMDECRCNRLRELLYDIPMENGAL
ncbi:MAG: hypothetical protein IJE07_05195 [Clostridia bacterium]|nr:hypothetical protein [Clostridia bacterium]